MKVVVGRIISLLAVLLLASGYYFAATNTTEKVYTKKDFKVQLTKLVDTQDEFSSLEEEEEEENFNADFSDTYWLEESPIYFIPVYYKSFRHIYKSQCNSNIRVPLWLKNRSIII